MLPRGTVKFENVGKLAHGKRRVVRIRIVERLQCIASGADIPIKLIGVAIPCLWDTVQQVFEMGLCHKLGVGPVRQFIKRLQEELGSLTMRIGIARDPAPGAEIGFAHKGFEGSKLAGVADGIAVVAVARAAQGINVLHAGPGVEDWCNKGVPCISIRFCGKLLHEALQVSAFVMHHCLM